MSCSSEVFRGTSYSGFGPFTFIRREARQHQGPFVAHQCSPDMPWALPGCRKWLFWQGKLVSPP